MDNTIILSRIALISIFAISITVLVAMVLYLWRQRHESKSLRIRVDALGKLIGAHTQGVAEIGDMFARNSNGVASLDTLIRAVDDKLSEHIVTLTDRANAARENIVTLTDGQNIQRAGLDVTVDAITKMQSELTKLAVMTDEALIESEQSVARNRALIDIAASRIATIDQRLDVLAQQVLDTDETTAVELGIIDDELEQRRQALADKLTPIMQVSGLPLLNLAHFEHALRGATDFGEFVEMYIKQSGD